MRGEAALTFGLVLVSCASTAGQLGTVPTKKQIIDAYYAYDLEHDEVTISGAGKYEKYVLPDRRKVRSVNCASTATGKAQCQIEHPADRYVGPWNSVENFEITQGPDEKPRWTLIPSTVH
jgi:hypothetical protein